ncbi:hypothetical protein CL619_00085 [archaeon]|nr:hypothetical protein [archaeon]
MIDLIHILPLEFLYHYFEDFSPKTHMAMAHLLLEDEKYCNWVKGLKKTGVKIVLDNSAPYLGRSIDNDKFMRCIDLVNPDEIVLPDEINSFESTKTRTLNFLDSFETKDICTIAVPQGATLDEYIECYQLFSSNSQIDKIGISYTVDNLFVNEGLPERFVTARHYLIHILVEKGLINPNKDHHLLGFGNSATLEIRALREYEFITRADSNTAFKLAKHDLPICIDKGYEKPKSKFSFDEAFDNFVYSRFENWAKILELAGREIHQPFVISDVNTHTMEDGLYKYLEIKMHQKIREHDYKKIIVIGEFNRREAVSISNFEKNDKQFNWQRPTCLELDDTLLVLCAPGLDYVQHYASLISSYLALQNRKSDHVRYVLPTVKKKETFIEESNLSSIKTSDVVILGTGLEQLFGATGWNVEGGSFGYKQIKIDDNAATVIGCKFSYWGDISRSVVKQLAKQGVKKVIYSGKLGGMKASMRPNRQLATGDKSFVEGKIVGWNNIFAGLDDETIVEGLHYTSPSIMFEDKEWLALNLKYGFVDPEIGQMALAANEAGIEFSYLHVISNNLAELHPEDLSNERNERVQRKRELLYQRIYAILEQTLSQ